MLKLRCFCWLPQLNFVGLKSETRSSVEQLRRRHADSPRRWKLECLTGEHDRRSPRARRRKPALLSCPGSLFAGVELERILPVSPRVPCPWPAAGWRLSGFRTDRYFGTAADPIGFHSSCPPGARCLGFPRECPRMREDANSTPVGVLIASSIEPQLVYLDPASLSRISCS
jgi:hypothetical protein